MNIEISKSKVYLFFFVFLFISYFLIGLIYRQDFKRNYLYSIATLTKVEYVGKSATNRAIFTYQYNAKSKNGRYNFANDSSRYYESQVGKRFLVKMSDKHWVNRVFFTYKLYMDNPVPDSIEAPPEGWVELPEWVE